MGLLYLYFILRVLDNYFDYAYVFIRLLAYSKENIKLLEISVSR